jgi:hypothetical protein
MSAAGSGSKKEGGRVATAQSLLKGLCRPRSGEVGGQAFRKTPGAKKSGQ